MACHSMSRGRSRRKTARTSTAPERVIKVGEHPIQRRRIVHGVAARDLAHHEQEMRLASQELICIGLELWLYVDRHGVTPVGVEGVAPVSEPSHDADRSGRPA